MRVVAVFGGGGAKSLAHAGAWKALIEAGLEPSHVIGTSMGAVIGAALAAGSSYDTVVETALALRRKDVAAVDAWSVAKGVFAANLFKPEPLKRTIARLVPAARFADMKLPLTITATDLDSGELVLFGALGQEAPLVHALYPSRGLPLYFPPGAGSRTGPRPPRDWSWFARWRSARRHLPSGKQRGIYERDTMRPNEPWQTIRRRSGVSAGNHDS